MSLYSNSLGVALAQSTYATVQHMGVGHGGADVAVAEWFLNCADVMPHSRSFVAKQWLLLREVAVVLISAEITVR